MQGIVTRIVDPSPPAACYGLACPKGEKGLGMTDFRYRAAARNVEAARDHGQTCAASRHVHTLLDDPQHCAESIATVLAELWHRRKAMGYSDRYRR